MTSDARAHTINIMFFTRASHDHGGVLELRSGLNPSGQLVVSVYKVVIKAIIEFSCVQYVENNITSYDVSIGSWLDVEHLLQLVWIGLA